MCSRLCESHGCRVLLAILVYIVSFAVFAGIGVAEIGEGAGALEDAVERWVLSPSFIQFYVAQITLLPFVLMLILACVYVAIKRAAVDPDYFFPPGAFFFRLGLRELRFFLTQWLYAFYCGVVAVVMIGAIFTLAGLAIAAADALDGAAQLIIYIPVAGCASG